MWHTHHSRIFDIHTAHDFDIHTAHDFDIHTTHDFDIHTTHMHKHHTYFHTHHTYLHTHRTYLHTHHTQNFDIHNTHNICRHGAPYFLPEIYYKIEGIFPEFSEKNTSFSQSKNKTLLSNLNLKQFRRYAHVGNTSKCTKTTTKRWNKIIDTKLFFYRSKF